MGRIAGRHHSLTTFRQLRKELESTTAERDYLRQHAFTERDRDRAKLLRAIRRDSQRSLATSFQDTLGYSNAPIQEDPRIGQPKRMLVIGGGPAGLITLHELLNPFNRPKGVSLDGYDIQLYERRDQIGGVWYFEQDNAAQKGWSPSVNVSTTEPAEAAKDDDLLRDLTDKNAHGVGYQHASSDSGYASSSSSPKHNSSTTSSSSPPAWPTPAYEGLVGNVLIPLLRFSAMPFPEPADGLFPSALETHQYLLDFAAPMRSHIRTSQEVTSVTPVYTSPSASPTWTVESRDWTRAGHPTTTHWDAVLVCPGAFDQPYWPPTPGLAALRATHPSLVMHAKTYPGPRPFAGRHNRILVVGNANSANDIAAHLAPLNSGPLYRAIRHPSLFAHLPDPRITDMPPLASLSPSPDGTTATATLTDGRTLQGLTTIIFATGYTYAFPYLHTPSPIARHGAVPNLHLATLHAQHPTLALLGLSVASNPIPLSEVTARLAARTFWRVQPLPSPGALGADARARAAELGLTEEEEAGWRGLHALRGAPERALLAALLAELEAGERGASEGLFRWDEERETVVKGMRAVKEGELRRIRDERVAAGGVDGGVGGVLAGGGQ